MADRVFRGYHLQWEADATHWETLETEPKFVMPLNDEWVFEGKLDRIARDRRTGKLWLWERKTAAQTGPSYFKRLPLDPQIKGYCLAARESRGLDVQDVVYDVFKKPAVQPHVGEGFVEFNTRKGELCNLHYKKYFERKEVHFDIEEIEAYKARLLETTEMLDWCYETGIWLQHHPSNRKGGCDFMPICLALSKGEESPIQQLYTVRPIEHAHPEFAFSPRGV